MWRELIVIISYTFHCDNGWPALDRCVHDINYHTCVYNDTALLLSLTFKHWQGLNLTPGCLYSQYQSGLLQDTLRFLSTQYLTSCKAPKLVGFRCGTDNMFVMFGQLYFLLIPGVFSGLLQEVELWAYYPLSVLPYVFLSDHFFCKFGHWMQCRKLCLLKCPDEEI